MVSGSFNQQRELTYEASLGQPQDKWIPTPVYQILKVCKETLTGFSHVYCASVLNTTSLSQSYDLGAASEKWES